MTGEVKKQYTKMLYYKKERVINQLSHNNTMALTSFKKQYSTAALSSEYYRIARPTFGCEKIVIDGRLLQYDESPLGLAPLLTLTL